jgi:insecticidal toxin complex protein TccC
MDPQEALVPDAMAPAAQAPEQARTFPCTAPGCDYVAKKNWILTQHLRQHSGEKPFPCRSPGCTYAFASRSGQKRHEAAHDKPSLKCPFPGCTFFAGSNSSMVRHSRKEDHGPALPCPFPNCGLLFKSYAVLKMHKRGSSHSGEGGLSVCQTCSATFDTVPEYRAHVRTHRVDRLVAFAKERSRKNKGVEPPPEQL